jgi:hypothetical protein
MTTDSVGDWPLWRGIAFISCIFVAMMCLGFMCFAAKWTKGGFLFLPWESNKLVEEYRRRLPDGLIYKIFSVSAISSAVLAALFLMVVLWEVSGAK